jgi:predicted pyridoxine 5'-phosphate oxidase superfamily flavin-nucleotide-binding protein
MDHPGEISAQARAGVRVGALGSARVGRDIPAVAVEFLGEQSVAFIGARDANGAMWSTMLTGPPGFIRAQDDGEISIASVPGAMDPLAGVFETAHEVGMLVIDLSTRRRMRINGTAVQRDTGLLVHPDQVYANCPKYIQLRALIGETGGRETKVTQSQVLTNAQQELIAHADTFFIATQADPMGADVSHRGGHPGFVTASRPDALSWPEYSGNLRYMTPGNLELDPRAGLLFVEWDKGNLLHVTGRAYADWDQDRAAASSGGQQMVDFDVDGVVHVEGANPLTWSFGGYSKFNPA